MEISKTLPKQIGLEQIPKNVAGTFIYAGKLALVDFGGKFPNGNDADPNFTVAAIIIGASAIKLARQII